MEKENEVKSSNNKNIIIAIFLLEKQYFSV
jgi:hypothetical protein